MDPSLLNHYEAELAFVRETGGEFAREFPKIAARLNLGSFDVADPYVERLFEGFALLAARIQLKLEAEFPTFTQSLLQMVYPHYLAPTPAMAVVQFRPGGQPARRSARRHAAARHRAAQPARHRGPDQLRIPHRPSGAAPADRAVGGRIHRLARRAHRARPAGAARREGGDPARLRATGEAPFAQMALERLPLFLAGPEGARVRLYEQLVANLTAVYVRPAQRPLPWQERLPAAAVRPLGFEPEEALLPRTPASFEGYRLLQEYFAMPERFLFVELGRLDRAVVALRRAGAGDRPAAQPERAGARRLVRSRSSGAVLHAGDQPVPQARRPHQPQRREAEYHVVPDRVRPLDFEVFGVTAVEGYAADGSAPQPFLPFYAANDLTRNAGAPGLLHAAPRAAAALARAPGSAGRDRAISATRCTSRWSIRSRRR